MALRPENIEALVQRGLLKESDRDEESIRSFIDQAKASARDAGHRALSPYNRFMIAYDALHGLSMAVLTHFGVRGSEGHRQIAFQIFLNQTGLQAAMRGSYKVLMDAHGKRNDLSYESPYPPPSHAEADALVELLAAAIPATEALVQLKPANKPPGAE